MGYAKGHTPAQLSTRGLVTACDPLKAGAPQPVLGLPLELESPVAQKGPGGLCLGSPLGEGHRPFRLPDSRSQRCGLARSRPPSIYVESLLKQTNALNRKCEGPA